MCLLLAGCGTKLPDTITYDNMFDYDISSNVKLGEYKNLAVTKDSTDVTDEDVEKQIASILDGKKQSIEVTDRDIAQDGDVVVVDFTGYKDGVAFDGGAATDSEIVLGSGQFIDGFEEAMVGHKVGEEFEFNITFPENYGATDLAGQEVTFKVTIKKILKYEVPELTDQFVTENSETSKTIDEYKAEIKQSLSESNIASAESSLENSLWGKVVENTEVKKYPEQYVEYYASDLKAYQEYYLQMIGYTLDQYLEQTGQTQEQYDAEINTSAQKSVKSLMVFQAIVDKEKITVSDEEYQAALATYLEENSYADEAALIAKEGEGAPKQIKNDLLLDKVIAFLKDNATIS